MLSVDAHFPDCEECNSDVFVEKGKHKTFCCSRCDRRWIDEEFEAVFALPTAKQTLYLRRKYGGYSFAELADGRYGDPSMVRDKYQTICEKINTSTVMEASPR